jgi:hypothetical protein
LELLDIKYEEYKNAVTILMITHYFIMQSFQICEGTGVLKIEATKPANGHSGCMACRGGRVYTLCPKGPRAMPTPHIDSF